MNYENFDSKIGFGKHRDLSFKELYSADRQYFDWLADKSNNVVVKAILNAYRDKKPFPGSVKNVISLEQYGSNSFTVRNPFNREILSICKNMEARPKYNGKKFDAWILPKSALNELITRLAPLTNSFDIENKVNPVVKPIDNIPDIIQEIPEKIPVTKAKTVQKPMVKLEELPFELFDYQKEGLDFIREKKNVLVAFDMGLGKTIMVIAYKLLEGIDKLLVVCTASTKINWLKELNKFANIPKSKIQIITGRSLVPITQDVVVINYDILKYHVEALSNFGFELLVLDESQKIKNIDSQRTKAALELKDIPTRILLSGTPFNKPAELYPQLHLLDPFRYNKSNWFIFANKYCNPKKIWNGKREVTDYSGFSNLQDLRQELLEIMIRQEKQDVLDLPDKVRKSVYVTVTKTDAYKELEERYKRLKEMIKTAIKRGGTGDRKVTLKQLKNSFMGVMSQMRRESVECKMPAIDKLLESLAAANHKSLIFTSHTNTIKHLKAKLGSSSVYIDGSTPTNQRQDIVDKFQNDNSVKFFVGNIRAAGEGITLTKATKVFFLEMDWSPSFMVQAEDRAYRIGQTKDVEINYVLGKGLFDEKIYSILQTKQRTFNEVMKGKAEALDIRTMLWHELIGKTN